MPMYSNPYGYYASGGIWNGVKHSFREGSALTRLIYINIGVFLVLKIAEVLLWLAGYQRTEYLLLAFTGVPAMLEELLYTPWTALTYMFTHFGFLHLLFNLLWLYWFGRLFQEHFSGRKLVGVYILGGLFGAALYMAAYSLLPAFAGEREMSRAIGASAAVMAVVFAVCTYLPNHRIYVFLIGPVRLIHLALFTVLIDLLSIPNENAGGHIAHLGGALFGCLFTLFARRNVDIAGGFAGFFEKIGQKLFARKKGMRVKYKRTTRQGAGAQTRAEGKKERGERINDILDKISKSGYESLTREEKELLFKSGRN